MAIESYLYPYKLHTLPSGVSQTGISPPQVPDSELLPTSPEPKENHGNAGGCFGCLVRCFFFGVGQTLKRI